MVFVSTRHIANSMSFQWIFSKLIFEMFQDLLKTNLEGLENTVMNQLVAILIIPLFFSKGVLFWLYFFILHVIGYVKVGKAKKNLLVSSLS